MTQLVRFRPFTDYRPHREIDRLLDRSEGDEEAISNVEPQRLVGRKPGKLFRGLPGLEETARNSLIRRQHRPFERQIR